MSSAGISLPIPARENGPNAIGSAMTGDPTSHDSYSKGLKE
jgi:hypothetical protein